MAGVRDLLPEPEAEHDPGLQGRALSILTRLDVHDLERRPAPVRRDAEPTVENLLLLLLGEIQPCVTRQLDRFGAT